MGQLLLTQRLEIELVHQLHIAYSSGAAPAVVAHASPYQWANACCDLWDAGRLDVLGHALRYLQPLHHELTVLTTLQTFLDSIPHDLPPPSAFCDDPTAEIQIVPRADCEQVLFCFCATNGTLGLPLNFVHQWLGRLAATLVYIKDFRDIAGAGGYPTLGPDRASAVVAFRRIAHEVGARRIYTLGVSRGGFSSLYYGLALEASAILNLAGATDLTPAFLTSLGPIPTAYRELCRIAPDYAISLRHCYECAPRPPRVLIAYNQWHPWDRGQAEQMAGLPNVELLALDHAQHDVVGPLIRDRRFFSLLCRLLAGE